MKLEKFKTISEFEKKKAIMKHGEVVNMSKKNASKFFLYRMNDFYIELEINIKSRKVVKTQILKPPTQKAFEKYLNLRAIFKKYSKKGEGIGRLFDLELD